MACEDDFDCPPAQICYVDVGWQPGRSFCDCSSWYGWQGDDCLAFGGTTIYLIAATSLMAFAAAGIAFVGCQDLFKMVAAYKSEISMSTPVLTLLATTAAAMSHFMWSLLLLLVSVTPHRMDTRAFGSSDKTSPFGLAQRPFVFLTQVLTVIACLHVSVMWIELAYRARNVRVGIIQSVTYYRRAVITAEVLFSIAMALTAATGNWDLSLILALPFLVIICICFALGRARMVAVLKEAITIDVSTGSGGRRETTVAPPPPPQQQQQQKRGRGKRRAKTAAEKTRRAMVAIQEVSLYVILGIVATIVTGLLGTILSNMGGRAGWRNITPVGGFSFVTVLNTMLSASILYIIGAIMRYAHRSSIKLVRNKRGLPSSSAGTGSGDADEGTTGATSHIMEAGEGFAGPAARGSPGPFSSASI